MIREAGYPELSRVARLLSAAFQDDPVSTWLFPAPDRRVEVHPAFFEAFAVLGLEAGGVVYERADGIAATVWFPGGEDDDEDDFMSRFTMLDDDENERFGRLAGLMAENHPDRGPHMHLQFIAVHPDHQRSGVGHGLLAHNLAILDKDSTPAYLEASSQRSLALYRRHGFERTGTPFGPQAGPRMYPMWRELGPLKSVG